MYRNRNKKKIIADINMVPFIDIVLVLLIAFMVTTPLIMQGMQVNLPKASASPLKATKENTLILSVKNDGSYYLNAGSKQEQAITSDKMVSMVKKIHQQDPNVTVLVKGDDQVNYGKVVIAMTRLQQAGITDVGLVTDPRGF